MRDLKEEITNIKKATLKPLWPGSIAARVPSFAPDTVADRGI
jgi:hypothetical protein